MKSSGPWSFSKRIRKQWYSLSQLGPLPIGAIKEMLRHEHLTVRVTPYNASNHVVTFDPYSGPVTGNRSRVRAVLFLC